MSRAVASRDLEKQYINHITRLERAYISDSEIKEQADAASERFSNQHSLLARGSRQRKQDTEDKIIKENRKLLTAIMKINLTDNPILTEINLSKDQASQFDNPSKKKFSKQQRSHTIQSENLSLAIRMLNLPSLYQKKSFDNEFKQHKRRLSQITRFQPDPGFNPYSTNLREFNAPPTRGSIQSPNSSIFESTRAAGFHQTSRSLQPSSEYPTNQMEQVQQAAMLRGDHHNIQMISGTQKLYDSFCVHLRFQDLNFKVKPRTDECNDQFYLVLKTPKPYRSPFFKLENLYELQFSFKFKVKQQPREPAAPNKSISPRNTQNTYFPFEGIKQNDLSDVSGQEGIKQIQCAIMQNKGNRISHLGRMFINVNYTILKTDQMCDAGIQNKLDESHILGFAKMVFSVEQIIKVEAPLDLVGVRNSQNSMLNREEGYNIDFKDSAKTEPTSNKNGSDHLSNKIMRGNQLYSPVLKPVEEVISKRSHSNQSEQPLRKSTSDGKSNQHIHNNSRKLPQSPQIGDNRSQGQLLLNPEGKSRNFKQLSPIKDVEISKQQEINEKNNQKINEKIGEGKINSDQKEQEKNVLEKTTIRENKEETNKIRQLQIKLAEMKAELRKSQGNQNHHPQRENSGNLKRKQITPNKN